MDVQTAQIAVLSMDWSRFDRGGNGSPVPPLLRHIVQPQEKTATLDSAVTLDQLKHIPFNKRESALQDYTRAQVVRTLGLDSLQAFNPSQLLINLGMDSLMAVELKNRIDSDLGINLPIRFFLEEASVNSLATRLHHTLPGVEDPQQIGVGKTIDSVTAQQLLENIDRLSEQEVDALLDNLLEKEDEK